MNYISVLTFLIGAAGIILIVAPKTFLRSDKIFNRVIFTDADFFSSPRISGIFFIIIGTILDIAGYRFKFLTFQIFDYPQSGVILFYIFLILGSISIIFGFIFIFKPEILIKLSEVGNRVVFSEKAVYANPRFFGIVLVIIATAIFYLDFKRH